MNNKQPHLNTSSNGTTNPEACTIAPKELKELKRVYGKLCFNADKANVKERLKPIQTRLAELQGPEAMEQQQQQQVKAEIMNLEEQKETLEKEILAIQNRSDQCIRVHDVAAALRALGRKATKRDVQDMVWEVDEKLDNVIDWEEFMLMFERNIRDSTGLEPSSLYHMVQFMIYDRDDNGMVSIDETMNMLYARLGREKMEHTITKLFGGKDGAPIIEEGHQGGEIDFAHYWEVVNEEQTKMFQESELGRTMEEKKKKKTDRKK